MKRTYVCLINFLKIQATSFITGRWSGFAHQHAATIIRISSGISGDNGGRNFGSANCSSIKYDFKSPETTVENNVYPAPYGSVGKLFEWHLCIVEYFPNKYTK